MLKIKWRSDDGKGEVCPDSGVPVTPDMVEEMVRAAIAFVKANQPKQVRGVRKISSVFFFVNKTEEVMEEQRRVLRQNKKPVTADSEPDPCYGLIEVAEDSSVASIMTTFAREKDRVERTPGFSAFMIQAMKV